MKKFVTLLLTAALAVTAATTAFAAEIKPGENGNPNPASGSMNVEYTVTPKYTVIIPATVTLDSTSKQAEATVTAKDVTVPNNQSVKVSLNTDAFKVTSDEGAELICKVTKDGAAVQKNVPFLEVASNAAGKTGSAKLTFAIDGNVTYSGTYKGQVIFTVSYGN